MSLDPMLWAIKDAPLADAYELAVLIALAETANEDGCNSFLSIKNVAARARCSTRQVQRIIGELLDRKILALGDQSAAAHIDERYRPTVYDLMIPYDWFGRIDRINTYRAGRGRPPLEPTDRPAIAEPPDRPRRADYGKPKPRKNPAPEDGDNPRGDLQSPLDGANENPQVSQSGLVVTPGNGHSGVTTRSVRGDYKVGQGRLAVTQPVTNNHQEINQPPPPPSAQQVPDSTPPATVVEVVGSPPRDTTAAQTLLTSLPAPWTPGPRIVARVVPMVQDYLDAGWTVDALCARWTSVPAQNPQGALLYRIEDTPPCPAATGPARGAPVRPACDVCGAHEGDPWTWREDRDTGKPCPVCRPDAAASA